MIKHGNYPLFDSLVFQRNDREKYLGNIFVSFVLRGQLLFRNIFYNKCVTVEVLLRLENFKKIVIYG